jgi:hypothetical protein
LRVALVCAVWGEEFAEFFARYCVPSLLEPHNIPLVSREQNVTLLLYTDRATQVFLERCGNFQSLSRFAKVEALPLEQFPAPARTNHWIPWRHAVAGRSGDFDRFLIIIPDCVYAAGCLGTIIEALEEHDTVYYTLPQVCRETITIELDRLRRVDDHEYISFNSLEAVELFIRHVNPKHAAADCSSPYLIGHPEYAIQLSPKSMVVSETGSHPFAVRSSSRCVSYVLDSRSPGAKARYLEILGVSAEPALKFVEEYYRWPKLYRGHSRAMNLGSWAWNFRDASAAAYSKSATHVTLHQGCVLDQHRGQVTRAKTRFVNATLDYLAVATRVHERARQSHDPTVAKYVALAIAAPRFHRHLRRLQSDLTVVLPKTGNAFEEVVECIESHPVAQEILRRFYLLHVIVGQRAIVPGLVVFLTYSDAGDQFAKAFAVDPHTVGLGAGIRGKALSPLQWVWENVFCIEADIDYSHLTWSMLDPENGTAEPVLGQTRSRRDTPSAGNVANLGFAKAHDLAPKPSLMGQPARLVRDLYLKARRRLWLNLENAVRNSPVSRLVKRKAPRLHAIAVKVYRGLRGRSAAAPRLSISSQIQATEDARANYDAMCKVNIVDNVAKVTRAFYQRLGLNPQQSPVYRSLASVRAELAEEVEPRAGRSTPSSLERFERAWQAYEAGQTHEALQLFREVIADERLAGAAAADPRSREAFIRSAEILGRHAELQGDTGAAAELYRRILELDGSGIVARRLLLMLWREGRLRKAAELAPRVLQSDGNLAQHVRGSDAVNDLTRRFQREADRQPTTTRGHNDRDLGLQAR